MERHSLRIAFSASVVALLLACSPIQTVQYPVREPDGRTTTVDKYYSSVLKDDPGDRSFKQIQAGKVEEALATMRAQAASDPNDSGAHYDIAIIHEMQGDWPNALTEIKEANRLSPKSQMYIDEEKFIVSHQPKN